MPVEVEEDSAGRDDRPVSVHVHPVGEGEQHPVRDDHRLKAELPRDPERLLDPQELAGVRERPVDLPFRQAPDPEVDEHGERDQGRLAPERDRRAERSGRYPCHAATIARAAAHRVGPGPEPAAANYARGGALQSPA